MCYSVKVLGNSIKKHSGCSERHFLLASDRLPVASVATRISTVADGVLLLPALGARISLAHAPALVVPSHSPKSGSPCDSFGCYHGWAVGQDYRKGGVRGFDVHKRIRGRNRHILVDTLGIPIANRVKAANMSDRRAGARLLGGLGPIFPTINTVIADAGHQSRKLTRLIKAEGYELRIVKRRKRAFEVCGSHLDRRTHLRLDRTVPSREQGLRGTVYRLLRS